MAQAAVKIAVGSYFTRNGRMFEVVAAEGEIVLLIDCMTPCSCERDASIRRATVAEIAGKFEEVPRAAAA